MKENTYEWCPYCDTEVYLENVEREQLTICPNCGRKIMPCSLCNGDCHTGCIWETWKGTENESKRVN